ncbi:MAG: hypothetical protein HZC28_05380 [Spirochaetes bacterium]|nr:hypothetical protein [Spirochaetota bacterium]
MRSFIGKGITILFSGVVLSFGAAPTFNATAGQTIRATSSHGIILEIANPLKLGVGYNFYDSMLMSGGHPFGLGRGVILSYAGGKDNAFLAKPFAYFFAGKAAPYIGGSVVFGSDLGTRNFIRIAPEIGFSLTGLMMFYYSLQFPVYPAVTAMTGEIGLKMYFFPLFSK